MKHLKTLVLSAALTACFTLAAAATGYGASITVNGTPLNTAGLPGSSLLPMRLITQADYGHCSWMPEENKSLFALDGHQITVSFADNSVEADGRVLPAVKAEVKNGVTFLPASVLEGLEGYEVTQEGDSISITTPNGAPLVRLCRQIIADTDMASGMKVSSEELSTILGIRRENFSGLTAFVPMMINSDTVIVGRVTGNHEEARADLQAQLDKTIASFEHYLPGPYEMAKNGRIVESGDYMMLIISPDNDAAEALFLAAVKDL